MMKKMMIDLSLRFDIYGDGFLDSNTKYDNKNGNKGS